jgi:hypothetical protein
VGVRRSGQELGLRSLIRADFSVKVSFTDRVTFLTSMVGGQETRRYSGGFSN